MSVTMVNKNASIDSNPMKFDDDFVTKSNRNSQVRNRSFKPPSPLFQQKSNDENNNQIIYTGSNGRISNYVSDVFNKRASTRSRRTSTPPFSTEFNEIECNTAKSR